MFLARFHVLKQGVVGKGKSHLIRSRGRDKDCVLEDTGHSAMGEQPHRRKDWRDTGQEERSQRTWLPDHTGGQEDTENWRERRMPLRTDRGRKEAGYQLLCVLQEGRGESSPAHRAVLAVAGCLCPVTQAPAAASICNRGLMVITSEIGPPSACVKILHSVCVYLNRQKTTLLYCLLYCL